MKYWYPTSVLVTSRDIITLWVARMVVTGLYNVGQIPFHHVYIHPKIMDGFGEGMSKSKGNGLDPLDIIDLYGTDAMRYGVVKIATETQDSRMPVVNVCPHCGEQVAVKQEHMYMRTKKLACPKCKQNFRPGGPWPAEDPELKTAKQASDRFELGRNFANKLWNATRFILMNLEGYTPAPVDVRSKNCRSRTGGSSPAWPPPQRRSPTALEGYHFSEVARLVYEFVWSEFCDWYIEMSKGRLKDAAARPLAQRVLTGVLDGILRLVHPVMPFVAESLWQYWLERVSPPSRRLLPLRPGEGRPTLTPRPYPSTEANACIAKWPSYPAEWIDARRGSAASLADAGAAFKRRARGPQPLPGGRQDAARRVGEVLATAAIAKELHRTGSAFIGPLALGNLDNVRRRRRRRCQAEASRERCGAAGVRRAYVSLRSGLIDAAAEAKRTEKQIAEKRKALDRARRASSGATLDLRPPSRTVVTETRARILRS